MILREQEDLLPTTGLHCNLAKDVTLVLTLFRRAGFRQGTGFVVILGVSGNKRKSHLKQSSMKNTKNDGNKT